MGIWVLLSLVVTAPPRDGASAPELEEAPPAEDSGTFALGVGVEAGLTSWPEMGAPDLLGFARPLLSMELGEVLRVELGATLNLLMVDTAPSTSERNWGGVLRRADWDERSDFGQLVRDFRLGKEGSAVWLRAGALRLKTLGHGHLVNRYSNQESPNYHPAGAGAGLQLGPVRAELLASDVLGARLFAASVGLDVGRLFSGAADLRDRFVLSADAAHDFGEAGGPPCQVGPRCATGRLTTQALSLLHFDFSALVLRASAVRVQLLVGAGGRLGAADNLGALAGLTLDTQWGPVDLGAKVEARKQGGGFWQGMWGPQHELARFAVLGFGREPLAEHRLPDGGSLYAEVHVGRRGAVTFEGAVEHYFWGRTDVDASMRAELLGSRLVGSARFSVLGLGVQPRYAAQGELRVRVLSALYALGGAGTVFFPQADGTLQRGVFASLGAGVDLSFAR